jgi:uncharacterized phage protein (TIGR02218 family)
VRRDNTKFFFTDHDLEVTFNGELYTPAGGFSSSARSSEAGLKESNLEFIGMVTSDSITVDDLRAGLFRDAQVSEFLVDWKYPWAGAIKTRVYWVDTIEFDGEVWQADITGVTSWMRQKVGDIFSRPCGYDLGDPNTCRVDLNPLTVLSVTTTTLDSTEPNRILNIASGNSAFDAEVDGYFKHGKGVWTSGNNKDLLLEAKEHTRTPRVVELHLPTAFDVQVGDTFTLFPGCDKLKATCNDKFSNIENHGGKPDMPTTDTVIKPALTSS